MHLKSQTSKSNNESHRRSIFLWNRCDVKGVIIIFSLEKFYYLDELDVVQPVEPERSLFCCRGFSLAAHHHRHLCETKVINEAKKVTYKCKGVNQIWPPYYCIFEIHKKIMMKEVTDSFVKKNTTILHMQNRNNKEIKQLKITRNEMEHYLKVGLFKNRTESNRN